MFATDFKKQFFAENQYRSYGLFYKDITSYGVPGINVHTYIHIDNVYKRIHIYIHADNAYKCTKMCTNC